MSLFCRLQNFPITGFVLLVLLPGLYLTGSASGSGGLSENDTLAVIGKKIITAGDFVESYKEKIMQVGLTDNGEVRLNYLMNLVNDELLISEAEQRGLDKTEDAQKEYKRIRLQELLNAYTLKHISPTINITDDDLKELFAKLNTSIKVSHLYAPSKEKADSLYIELLNGKKFEDLARENFTDPELQKNGGALGYITIDEMDPAFEKAAYSIGMGEISEPVKTVRGYSLIRVEDIKRNPLLTENEFNKVYDRLKAFARKRAFEDASKKFSDSLSRDLKVELNDEIIEKIFTAISQKNSFDVSESPSVILQKDLDKNAVYSASGNLSLRMLIEEMSLLSERQKGFIRTKENLEDVIRGLINRKYIEQKAIEENLDRTPEFRKNVEYAFDTYLLTTLEVEMKKQILIPEDSLKSYYLNNLNLFMTEPAVRLSSILVDDVLLADSISILLEEGFSFEELAKKFSMQELTAEKGGDMGFFKRSELDYLADEIFSLKTGQWAGPFSDSGKYVFLKPTDLTEPVLKSFEESEVEIEKSLITFEWLKVRDKFLKSLGNDIGCKLFPEKLYAIKL